jgi:predicted secreted protein
MERAMLGTRLEMADTAEGTYKTLYGLAKVPDMSFEAEKIEVTNFQDKNKRYIPGVVDLGDPEFEFYNDDTTTEPTSGTMLMNSYKALREAETSHKVKYFRLIYPDKTGFAFSAYVVTTRTGGGTGDALQFKAKMLINSDIEDITDES